MKDYTACWEALSETQKKLRPSSLFPEPPVPGMAGVVPIESTRDLINEGRMQGNCVENYEDPIRRGEVYLYNGPSYS